MVFMEQLQQQMQEAHHEVEGIQDALCQYFINADDVDAWLHQRGERKRIKSSVNMNLLLMIDIGMPWTRLG